MMKRVGMISKISTLALAAATCAIGLTGPAFAQSQDDARASPADETQPAGSDIVVTAQRRDTKLLETPVSIGVLTAADLDSANVRGVSDALTRVAGVSLIESKPGETSIAIRGALSGAGTSATGFYLDDVPFAFIRISTLPDSNAYDLARVEVLRGPQGTLYGASSLNGTVRIITNDPDLDAIQTSGRIRVSDTSRGGGINFQGDLMANLPLVPGTLAVRGVVGYGYLSGFIRSRLDGRTRINDTDAQNYRFKVRFQPSDNFTLDGLVSHGVINNGAPSQSLDDFTTAFRSNQSDDKVLDVYSLVANYDAGAVSLYSATGYVDYTNDANLSISGIDLKFAQPARSFTQELRISSSDQGPWQWTIGGFYKHVAEDLMQDARPVPGFEGVLRAHETSQSYAAFADVTRKLFDDRLELTGGIRYFHDKHVTTQISNFNVNAPGGVRVGRYEKVTGRALVTFKPSSAATFYASYSTGFRSGMNQSSGVLFIDPTFPDVRPDSITNYEFGAKGSLAEGMVTYETAVYYTDWKDTQQIYRVPQGFNARVNIPGAHGVGAEGRIAVKASDSLSFEGTLAWNDLRINETSLSRNQPLFLKGSRLNDSPEWTGSFGLNYRGDIGNDIRLVAAGNLTYSSARLLRYLSGNTLTVSASDEITAVNVSIGIEKTHWSLGLFATNLFDERGAVQGRDSNVSLNAARLRPRTIGIQGTFKY